MSEQLEETEEYKMELKPCFIITPIGEPGSEVFTKAMGLIKSVIKPVLLENGFFPLPANDIASAGSINKQVIEHVVNDELVIANLTGFNPNVMYELAIRHSYKKKVIIMAEKGPKLPFDVNDQRTIFYNDTLHGVEEAVKELKKMIKVVLKDEVTSNPIIDVIKEAAVLSNIPSGDTGDTLKFMLAKLDRLESLASQRNSQPIFDNTLRNNTNIAKLNLKTIEYENDTNPNKPVLVLMHLGDKLDGINILIKALENNRLQIIVNISSEKDYKLFINSVVATNLFEEVSEERNNSNLIIYSK